MGWDGVWWDGTVGECVGEDIKMQKRDSPSLGFWGDGNFQRGDWFFFFDWGGGGGPGRF